MTSLSLSLWITLGIAVQLAIYLGINFRRHWTGYQALHNRSAGGISSVMPEHQTTAGDTTASAWTGFRTFRVARKVFEDTAQSVCSFHLVPEDGKTLPPFLPGQYLTFRIDALSASGGSEQITRCYSLSDAPHPDHYRVSIKRAAQGRSSSHFHDHVSAGSLLQVRAPAGHFHLDRSEAPVVLIGSGVGITPMLSMLNWGLAEQKSREMWLFYGVRNRRELVMKAQLDVLAATHPNFHLQTVFSNPLPDDVAGRDYQHHGRIDLSILRMQLPLKPYHYYICGPSPMMESLVPALEEWGVPAAHIHFEAFGPASVKRRTTIAATLQTKVSDGNIVINFAKSGKNINWTPATNSLLELAEANGIHVNSGCRSGSCSSCQTGIQSGEVSYRQPPDFDPQPGTCLLCVCTPKTSLSLEA